jgi:hypothetical protein
MSILLSTPIYFGYRLVGIALPLIWLGFANYVILKYYMNRKKLIRLYAKVTEYQVVMCDEEIIFIDVNCTLARKWNGFSDYQELYYSYKLNCKGDCNYYIIPKSSINPDCSDEFRKLMKEKIPGNTRDFAWSVDPPTL